jgi:hypothetical protein
MRFGLGLVLGIAIMLAAAVVIARQSGFTRDSVQIDASQPSVIRQIRQLERLETVVYSMEKLIGGQHENRYLPKFLAGDRLLLIVHGEVTAGVDLRKLQPSDVAVNARSIRLRLPSAEIFATRLDNQRTRVYSRDTGLFSSLDPQLETEVRRAGEQQIQEAALNDGILQTAAQNARATLTSLLKGFGFEQVLVQ